MTLKHQISAMLPAPMVFDTLQDQATEDAGMARLMEISGATNEVYVRVISWDESKDREHAEITPFWEDPSGLRVTLEKLPPAVSGAPETLEDTDLGHAREHAARVVVERHAALLRAKDPRADTSEVVISLAEVELREAEEALEAIDTELRLRC